MIAIGEPFNVLHQVWPPYVEATARLKHILAEYGLGWSDDLEHLPESVQELIEDARVNYLMAEINAEILFVDGLVN